MGFNTWNRFGMHIDETLIERTMDALVETGLRDLGYVYVNIDDGWMAPERDAAGRLAPDPDRFPHGILRLAERAHALGLKLGIYSDCGVRTCGGLPASYGHERQDAETFASWEVDYLKQDWCNVPLEEFPGKTEREVAQILYGRISDALVAQHRPVVLSMCNWGHGEPWEWARGVGHLWRTTGDIEDVYRRTDERRGGDLVGIFSRNVGLDAYGGPGGWNDPDMLEVGNGGMTDVEYRTHFALWCLMAAPLLIGTDLTALSLATRQILTNRHLIAVNQDALGRQARRVRHDGVLSLLVKPLAAGDAAVGLFNEGDEPCTTSVNWDALGLSGDAQDLWTGERRHVSGTEDHIQLAPHETKVWRVAHR